MAGMAQLLAVWLTVAMVIAMVPGALKRRHLALAVVPARPAPRSHVTIVRAETELAAVVSLDAFRVRRSA